MLNELLTTHVLFFVGPRLTDVAIGNARCIAYDIIVDCRVFVAGGLLQRQLADVGRVHHGNDSDAKVDTQTVDVDETEKSHRRKYRTA